VRVEVLREALTTAPEAIAAQLPGLEQATATLRAIEDNLRHGAAPAPGLKAELEKLRLDLSMARRLAARGAEFCRSWSRLLGSGAAGYTRSGNLAPAEPPRQAPSAISVEG